MKILVTEDDDSIRFIISKQLQKWGFEVVMATNGHEALEIVNSDAAPDIIIMDWMMPGMDGVEACRRIKSEGNKPMIYIIILTSRNNQKDIVAGLDSGADDFITKPVSSGELHSRLKVAERTVGYERRLREYAHQMEELAQQRARQLVHADRLVTIGTMASGIVHEINNPLSAISGSSQVIQKYWEHLEPLVCGLRDQADEKEMLDLVLEELPEMVQGIRESCGRISNIVRNLRRFYRNSGGDDLEEYEINTCVAAALKLCRPKFNNRITVEQKLPEDSPVVHVCPQQLDQVLVNLLVNAAEAIFSASQAGQIRIEVGQKDGRVGLAVYNTGPQIPPDALQKIWESFYTTKDDGTGLGLAISRDIIKAFGGEMTAENLPQSGEVVFTISLPVI